MRGERRRKTIRETRRDGQSLLQLFQFTLLKPFAGLAVCSEDSLPTAARFEWSRGHKVSFKDTLTPNNDAWERNRVLIQHEDPNQRVVEYNSLHRLKCCTEEAGFSIQNIQRSKYQLKCFYIHIFPHSICLFLILTD